MGKHARPRTHRAAKAVGAAVPVIASIALASPAHASSTIPVDEVVSSWVSAQVSAQPLKSLIQVIPKTYTVAAGDSLSSIAQVKCGTTADWSGLYKANEKTIGPDFNLITPGEVLTLDCSQAAIPQQPQPVVLADVVPVSSEPVSIGNYSGFQACVIARESGGNPDIWNASGHWGLYQFSESTWIAYGGSAADFGHASVAEQNRIFANAMATPGGAGNWSPYDGC